MLQEIYISNFVLIDKLRLEFHEGLNVLTGETGAGKSIIIDALGLIMGERIKNDFIRDSNHKAVAEAVFDLSNNMEARSFLGSKDLIEAEEDSIVISREIAPNGRSTARINGRNVSAGSLKTLATFLLDMHLQHEHLSILRPEMYLKYVDSFMPESENLLKNLEEIFDRLKDKEAEIQRIKASEQDKLQKVDFLDYQIKEIEGAGLRAGEDEELLTLKRRVKNAQRLMEGTQRLQHLLYSAEEGSSAYDLLSSALDTAAELKHDDYFARLLPDLEDIFYSLEEISGGLRSFRDSLDFEPGILEEVEDRLYEIEKLKRKYGNSIEEIIDFLKKARQERAMLDRSQEKQEELAKDIEILSQEYFALASQLTEKRQEAALLLQETVNKELLQLNMPYINFAVVLEPRNIPASSGLDKVDFRFSPNPGEEMRSLSRIASGGEISRFVLALKKALVNVYKVPTLIFDEIDVGVGGTSLTAMAAKISELSHSHQVILVTHSPQVASYGDRHFLIEKTVRDEKTFTTVEELEQEDRLKEIARMMSGDNYSALTLQHARELLEKRTH